MRALIVLLGALSCQVSAQSNYGPTPVTLPQSALGGRLKVPEGFKVDTFAVVPGARWLALGPDGAIYVSQPRNSQITRLVDANGDGKPESQAIAVTGLNRPHGMAFQNGWFYIANEDGVVRVRLNERGVAAGTAERLNSYSTGGSHRTRTIVFGPDGAMYVSIGSSCNICDERNVDRATVMRYDADGKNGRVFSAGLRNAVGLAVNPTTREIWATQNERDMLQPSYENLPPEEINILKDGANYGWPWCHSDRVPNPEYNDSAKCAGTIPPALKMQAHSAPLGITFLDKATKFPVEYRGDALVAFHGSWNRSVPTGAKVVRIRIQEGKPVGYEDFIVGWQEANGQRWGRPADVMVAADGSVLVTDDQLGLVYRVYR
jgi:glucose/arabinose dehydrogenase